MSTKTLQSGFSLVETLVSITILLIVIVGPMTIITSSVNSTSFASDQVTAFFLAQEGAELAQKARDDVLIRNFANVSGSTWDNFSNPNSGGTNYTCFQSAGCALQINTNDTGTVSTPVQCTTASNNPCKLYFSSDENLRSRYTHTQSSNTIATDFSRVVRFEYVNDHEIKVISTVSWFDRQTGKTRNVIAETYLFDVYGN